MLYEDKIEYILEHLKTPGDLVEPEFVEWLQVKENQEIFEMVLSQREAYLRWENQEKIDIKKEYKHFQRYTLSLNSFRYWAWTGVVAAISVGLFLLFVINRSLNTSMEVANNNLFTGKKAAELILANGQRVKLENQTMILQEQNGVCITNDSNYQLAYPQDTLGERTGTSNKSLVYNTLQVPSGADYIVLLSDGTRVHLNCESEFRYPLTFGENERKVYLDGEAFFEVKKSSEWPFVVVTDQMNVKVTGTTFNVKSYKKDFMIETTLVSGAVEVESGYALKEVVYLAPSQQFKLDKNTGQTKLHNVDIRLFTDWTEGMFVFKDQRLEDVMNTLARWYPINVFYTTSSVKEWRLSANLNRYEHVDIILQMIRMMNKVEVIRKDEVVTIGWK